MKCKKILLAVLIAGLFCVNVSARERSLNYYKTMYGNARNMKEKRNLVKEMYKGINENYAPLISTIIDEQYNYGVERNKGALKDYEEWIYYTAMSAGALKLENKAVKLKTIYSYVKTPLYLGTIAHVLALTGAKEEVLPWLNGQLRELNTMIKKGSGDMGYKEEIVEGILLGMKEFKDASSFEPVFFAATPNYSEKVRKIALSVLEEITNDPVPLIENFINGEDDFFSVQQLLSYAHKSNSSKESKEKLFISVLDRCLGQLVEKNPENLSYKPRVEQDAVMFLGELPATTPLAVKLIGEKWATDNTDKRGVAEDTNVKLINIEALRKIATPEAVGVLLENLNIYYTAGKEGFGTGYGTKEGNKIFIAVIRALGETGVGNEDVQMALECIKIAEEFGAPVKREAEAALAKF